MNMVIDKEWIAMKDDEKVVEEKPTRAKVIEELCLTPSHDRGEDIDEHDIISLPKVGGSMWL